jgi:hypothetical protein
VQQVMPVEAPSEELMVQLLKAAEARGGKLSIAQGVLDSGANFSQVEGALKEMVRRRYVRLSGDGTQTVFVPEFQVVSDSLMLKLLKAAEARNGKLSVTQGVLDTGADFAVVEATLKEMVKTGHVDVTNDPESGVVLYDFNEL